MINNIAGLNILIVGEQASVKEVNDLIEEVDFGNVDTLFTPDFITTYLRAKRSASPVHLVIHDLP